MKIEQITSRDNQRLVNARKVRDGQITGKIFIEGRRLVEEALRSNVVVEECFFSEEFEDTALRKAVHGPAFELPAKLLASIADTSQPQGVVLIGQRPQTSQARIDAALRQASMPLVIYLHEINNPSNLGAVVRTAEAAGVAGVIVSNNSADVFSPKALRAAMGSSFRVPIWENADFDDVLTWADEMGLGSTAADISAMNSYADTDWKRPRLLLVGSEAHGLTDDQLAAVDETIAIPMQNGVESLNLAVSAGIILFEARRQLAD